MIKFVAQSFVILIVLLASPLSFAENSGPRTITDVGCHRNDHICFFTISGTSIGPEECKSISIRWNKNDPNGEAIFRL